MKNHEFFIGIDLGGKEKRTSGVCVLTRKNKNFFPYQNWCQSCQDIKGKEILKIITPYLKETKVIAIDAPLTRGRGKGRLRLYEKLLLTKIFRQEKVTPIPPALMPELCDFAREIVEKLEKRGFVLGINLVETFPTLVKKISKKNLVLQGSDPCKTENQKSALICGQVALLHSQFKTRYLGYKDGFLFLPEMSFWKKNWQKKFYQAWASRSRLKYRHLITNIFSR